MKFERIAEPAMVMIGYELVTPVATLVEKECGNKLHILIRSGKYVLAEQRGDEIGYVLVIPDELCLLLRELPLPSEAVLKEREAGWETVEESQ
jgi:hypothetical protein